MAATTKPRWVRNTDPHTPGFLLKRGRVQVGRVLYSDFARLYSCFVRPEGEAERFLGAAETPDKAKARVVQALGA